MRAGAATEARTRVLLCWGYHRSGWTRPFETLRNEADLEFEYLFYLAPEDEEQVATAAKRRYWLDFRDAHDLLDRVRPDRIVFMSLSGLWSIALNHAARRRGVPTFVMQHGVLEHSDAQLTSRALGIRSAAGTSSRAAAKFAYRTYRWRRLPRLLQPVALIVAGRRSGTERALRNHRFPDRLPDWYVCFSRRDAQHYVDVDRAEPSRMTAVGQPEFDRLFQALGHEDGGRRRHVLLIDTPNAGNRWGAVALTEEDKAGFIGRLADAGAALGLPVVVKLHPESFEDAWLPQRQDLIYLRDVDIAEPLRAAAVVVGFDSSLVVPALPARPTVLVRLYPHPLPDLAETLGAAVVLDGLDALDETSLSRAIALFQDNADARTSFVQQFSEHVDGRATRRLREVLTEPDAYYREHSLHHGPAKR